jgi:hypothetical protein
LFLLARDLEAEPPAGAAATASIAGKARPRSSLGRVLAIIHLIAQSAVGAKLECHP